MYKEDESDYYMSLRGIKSFATLLEDFPRRTALEISFFNKLDPETRGKIKDLADGFIPMATADADVQNI